jgi:hypothetical protein
MKYRYVWPETESFASAYACRFLPIRGKAQFSNVIFGPIVNLLDISKPSIALFSWALVGAFYALFYYLPIGFWNSADDQYLDMTRVYIATAVAYYVFSMLLIGKLSARGCSLLEAQGQDYLYGGKPPLPATLSDSVSE